MGSDPDVQPPFNRAGTPIMCTACATMYLPLLPFSFTGRLSQSKSKSKSSSVGSRIPVKKPTPARRLTK
ncbi:hypothetical protein BDN72DRAFT_850440 [Pluteus cervinus]|uniref:Uncharacterized protein n=1 Tax=Pluteus cervinus TaxID=181527 RepID=A0ACD3A4A3_9AGAR|nr:hypothetical protein BDN72DRAFT_850440 [Pluteus cervinus]